MVQVGSPVVYIEFGIYKIFVNFVGLPQNFICALTRDRPMSHANMKLMGQVGEELQAVKVGEFYYKNALWMLRH